VDLLAWLNQNSGAVTAIVTAVYAVFTILLWWATKRQAALTRRIFEASHRPHVSLWVSDEDRGFAPAVDALRVNAITENVGAGVDTLRFNAIIENVGTAPAEVTKWEVSGSLMDPDGGQEPVAPTGGEKTRELLLGTCLFPGRKYAARLQFRHPGIVGTPLPFRLRLTLEYRGDSKTSYRTRLEVERTPSEHRQRVRAT
jgi:hypothetical protein